MTSEEIIQNIRTMNVGTLLGRLRKIEKAMGSGGSRGRVARFEWEAFGKLFKPQDKKREATSSQVIHR